MSQKIAQRLLRVASTPEGLRLLSGFLYSKSAAELPYWDKFLKEKYEGGKKKVPNPNHETRGKYPQVSLSTAMKFEQGGTRPVYEKLKSEYQQWVKNNEELGSSKSKASPKKQDRKFTDLKHPEGSLKDKTQIFSSMNLENMDAWWRPFFASGNPSKDIIEENIAKISGVAALDDARVYLDSYYGKLEIKVSSKYIEYMRRDIRFEGGQSILHNDVLRLYPDAPEGIGTRIFVNQVIEAKRAGLDKIECLAYRADYAGWVGYKVWPKMGYDGIIPSNVYSKSEVRSLLKEYYPDHTGKFKVSDLLAIPGGSAIWDVHGDSFDAVFDLNNENQLGVLQAYLEKKAKKAGKSVQDFLNMGYDAEVKPEAAETPKPAPVKPKSPAAPIPPATTSVQVEPTDFSTTKYKKTKILLDELGHKLHVVDVESVEKWVKDKPVWGKKITDAEKLRRFLSKASPETRERMKSVTPAEFGQIIAAIMSDDETEVTKTASRRRIRVAMIQSLIRQILSRR